MADNANLFSVIVIVSVLLIAWCGRPNPVNRRVV